MNDATEATGVRDHMFATAIKILEDQTLDYRALVFRMAASHPEALVGAAAVVPTIKQKDPRDRRLEVASKINEAIKNGNHIEAIKLYRAETQQGLKESKDAIDAYRAGNPLVFNYYSDELVDEVKW